MATGSSKDVFVLHCDADAARAAADRLFANVVVALRSHLSASTDIRHVGATAVPGCLTKGDVDIVVRVAPADFAAADAALSKLFDRNTGSAHTDTFAAFANDEQDLGIQLTVIGGPFDDFHHFVEILQRNPTLVAQYNALKRAYAGRSMDDYRTAKNRFVEDVLSAHDTVKPV